MKRIIVCCDGTWQRPDQNFRGRSTPTNVTRLFRQVASEGGATPQIVWYDEGVGTGGNLIDRLTRGLTGAGLDENILQAYRFLAANYALGDELFLFGFSRGAYTVRSLAGLIRKCGILRRDRDLNASAVMALYRDDDHPSSERPTAFRAENSVAGTGPIPIKLIGVWDTVGALGIPLGPLAAITSRRYQFHDTKLSSTVELAYQALAIDERRDSFAPSLWSEPAPGQTMEQVWFSGTHSDVGGGAQSDGLPPLTLDWMIAKASGAGLVFDAGARKAHSVPGDPTARMNRIEHAFFWNLVGAHPRAIGLRPDERAKAKGGDATDPTQRVSPSARERWDRDPSYRPSNLAAFFRRTGDTRA